MAPPSGATNSQRGPAKKPVVPAIPYNLPHRQTPHQRQQSQQSQQAQQAQKQQQGEVQVQKQQTPNSTSKQQDQITKPIAGTGKQAPSQHQQAPAAASQVAGHSTSTGPKTVASTTAIDKTTSRPSGSTPNNSATPSSGKATAPESTSNTGNAPSKSAPSGGPPPHKKNHRHHGQKPNAASTSRTAATGQSKGSGTHDGKFRKNNPQPHKSLNTKNQRPKATTSEMDAPTPKPNGVREPSTQAPKTDYAPETNAGDLNTPKPPKLSTVPDTDRNFPTSGMSSCESGTLPLPHPNLPQDVPTPRPTGTKDHDSNLTSMRSQDTDILPNTNANGINGAARAEPVHFPSRRPAPPNSLHHPYPSNGSLVFGGFNDSNASSPAPPPSGGFMPPQAAFPSIGPPPGFADVNGVGHQQMNSDPSRLGPHPMVAPLAPEFVPATSVDTFPRPLVFAPTEGFPPMGEPYGPDTPHSFQGSASPLFPDCDGGPMEAGPYQLRGASPTQFPPHPGHFGHPMINPQMANMDEGYDLLGYMKSQFNNSSTADCTLEFRPVHGRQTPVHVDGHRMIFARSPMLKSLLERTEQHTTKPHIVVATEDKHINSRAFYTALQSLYGHSLIHPPHPSNGMEMAGNPIERFEFALDYAAAGHLLGLLPVVVRGLEIASQLINWDTIEKALSFALLGAPVPDIFPTATISPQRGAQFKYGAPTEMIMNGITHFLIHHWPRRFALDTSDTKVSDYERIPYFAPSSPRKSPPIAHGTRQSSVNPTLSSIQFGDYNPAALGGMPNMSAECTVLSRVLLNMPFPTLKFVLESMAHHSPGDREKAFTEVVGEREARRTRAISAVYAGGKSEFIKMGQWLDQGGCMEWGDPVWSVYGWKEDVSQNPETKLPCLVRWWFNEPRPTTSTSA
ncbi:hypothetical protein MKZ38_004974 [Zalerion maritima]|uniref:BTB domain-containing protein n=1 Tax=Zalerion maritima TaxID=339359 RepID=A0AAD5RKY2_9PEZI|nr:hypothetical protein MKZ38_004974 [Zalerion maritima]